MQYLDTLNQLSLRALISLQDEVEAQLSIKRAEGKPPAIQELWRLIEMYDIPECKLFPKQSVHQSTIGSLNDMDNSIINRVPRTNEVEVSLSALHEAADKAAAAAARAVKSKSI